MSNRRRSLHFVPGSNERMLSKAVDLPADALILDLEDSVTPRDKGAARRQVCEWLTATDCGKREALVRINPLASDWGRDDLEAVMQCPLDGIVVPKVAGPADVEALDRLLTGLETGAEPRRSPTRLVLIATELPAAVFELHRTASHPRVAGLAWAAEDLSAELGIAAPRNEAGEYLEVFGVVRSLTLLAAVAAGVQPIDGPYVTLRDTEGLRRECRLSSAMGFTGKLTIHPAQIEIVNECFMPSADELARARALLQAFEENQAQGRMAFTFEGRMVDVPHLKHARSVLDRAGEPTADD